MSFVATARRQRASDHERRYTEIVEHIFLANFRPGAREVHFSEGEINQFAKKLGIRVPEDPGDLVCCFRDPAALPESVRERAPRGKIWLIRSAGRSRYRFVATRKFVMAPREILAVTRVPSSTPDLIVKFALDEQQVLLGILRYDRLIDIFTGMSCYPVASSRHVEQANADEIYIGVDSRGAPKVFPIQATGQGEKLSVAQIERSLAFCATRFPSLVCAPIGAQVMTDGLIALLRFQDSENGIGLTDEKRYRLVPSNTIISECLAAHRLQVTMAW